MTIGERIRSARGSKYMTQREVGVKAGIAEPTIRRYELGKLNPKIETLQRIADAIGVPVSSLLGDHTININLDGAKNPEDMTPEELKEYLKELPKAMKKARERMAEFSDTLLDYNADSDEWLLQYYGMLNHDGRKEALKRIQELSRLPEYTKPDTAENVE